MGSVRLDMNAHSPRFRDPIQPLLKCFLVVGVFVMAILFFGKGTNQHLTADDIRTKLKVGMTTDDVAKALSISIAPDMFNEYDGETILEVSKSSGGSLIMRQHEIAISFVGGTLSTAAITYYLGVDEDRVSLLP